jgi:hypothetical protein
MGNAFSASTQVPAAGHFCERVFCSWCTYKHTKNRAPQMIFATNLQGFAKPEMLSTIAVDKVVQHL